MHGVVIRAELVHNMNESDLQHVAVLVKLKLILLLIHNNDAATTMMQPQQ